MLKNSFILNVWYRSLNACCKMPNVKLYLFPAYVYLIKMKTKSKLYDSLVFVYASFVCFKQLTTTIIPFVSVQFITAYLSRSIADNDKIPSTMNSVYFCGTIISYLKWTTFSLQWLNCIIQCHLLFFLSIWNDENSI